MDVYRAEPVLLYGSDLYFVITTLGLHRRLNMRYLRFTYIYNVQSSLLVRGCREEGIVAQKPRMREVGARGRLWIKGSSEVDWSKTNTKRVRVSYENTIK